MKALEFFSGIGAFAEASRLLDIEVVAAFDQNESANQVYEFNFGRKPVARNLDTIKLDHLPQASIWWMSPPCTPFSVRGQQKDDTDPRARSFLNIIELAGIVQPETIMIENVMGFAGSRVEAHLLRQLQPLNYNVRTFDLCPTMFGVPMRRPRHFIVLDKRDFSPESGTPQDVAPNAVGDFLFEDDPGLYLSAQTVERYGPGFDVVELTDHDATFICFTKNYERCMKASGSIVKTERGLRRVSPEEILLLLGFAKEFQFPKAINRSLRWRLVGNSVDVRSIQFILKQVCKTTSAESGAAGVPSRRTHNETK